MTDMPTVHIVIDGTALEVPAGEMIIESARRIGVDIPHFCFHPRLSSEAGGNCRMCLVEASALRLNPDGSATLAKFPKPQTSCTLPASEGMVIETETPVVVEARRAILEFLLINHPLDCPICDRGGECPLQNNTLHYGPASSRYVEAKRHAVKAWPLSRDVVFDRERCIHCARCTRFTDDISGDGQLGFLKRGGDMQVGTAAGTEFTSLFSGNTIELCPVGALLSRSYRFRARPWDLSTQESICTQCSNGCNIKLDHRAGKVERVNARLNEAVNEEWTCDRGKFGMAYVSDPARLSQPLIRSKGRFEPSSWADALDLVAQGLRQAGPLAALIGGTRSSNEDLYAMQRLFREVLGSNNLDCRSSREAAAAGDSLFRQCGHRSMHGTLAELEQMRSVLVFDSVLATEQPMLYLRVRKAWRLRGTTVVEASPLGRSPQPNAGYITDLASVVLEYPVDRDSDVAWLLVRYALEVAPGLPADTRSRIDARCRRLSCEPNDIGVAEADLRRAAEALNVSPMSVICGEGTRGSANGAEVVEALAALAEVTGNTGRVSLPVLQCNEQGAMDMGILPHLGPGGTPLASSGLAYPEMLAGLHDGRVSALWVSGMHATGGSSVAAVLEQSPFLVVSDMFLTDTAQMADVVLPVRSVAEKDGTFTNVEGRAQRFRKAFEPVCDVREEWQIAAQVAARLGTSMPYASASDVMDDIAAHVAQYGPCRSIAGDDGETQLGGSLGQGVLVTGKHEEHQRQW